MLKTKPSKRKESPSKSDAGNKPIDRMLGLLGIAVGVVLYLVPKTPAAVIIACLSIFGSLAHPIWNFWWVDRSTWRRIGALWMLALITITVGRYCWPPGETTVFPWLDCMGDSTATISGFSLRLTVKPYPQNSHPRPSLSHVHVLVSVPIAVSPNVSGWWSCNVADFEALEWNEDDAFRKPIGPLAFLRDHMPVQFEVTEHNGRWWGKGIISKGSQGAILIEQAVLGQTLTRVPLIVRQPRFGSSQMFQIGNGNLYAHFNREDLIAAGVPSRIEDAAHLKQVCGVYGYRYEQLSGPTPTTSMTLQHNFGK